MFAEEEECYGCRRERYYLLDSPYEHRSGFGQVLM